MAINVDKMLKEFTNEEIPVLDWYFAEDIEKQYNINTWSDWKVEYIPIASTISGDVIIVYKDSLYLLQHGLADSESYMVSDNIPLVFDILRKLKKYKKPSKFDSLTSLEKKQNFINSLIDNSPEFIQDILEQELHDIDDLIEDTEDKLKQEKIEVDILSSVSNSPLKIGNTLIDGFEEVRGADFASCDLLASGSLEAQKNQKEWVEKGYPLEVKHIETGMLFRLVPPGSFMMGTLSEFAVINGVDEDEFEDEFPRHEVTISYPFYVGKYPVTQIEYISIIKKNPSKFKKEGLKNPVENISQKTAKLFATKMNSNTITKIRLLSESEWEYSCRAGTQTAYYFGDEITTDFANYDPNYTYSNGFWVKQGKGVYRKKTTPVGMFLPNAYGIYDMHGNVDEWIEDIYHDNYIGAPTDGSAWIEGKNNFSVCRGGSWNDNYPWSLRSASRGMHFRDAKECYLGFRVAFDLKY